MSGFYFAYHWTLVGYAVTGPTHRVGVDRQCRPVLERVVPGEHSVGGLGVTTGRVPSGLFRTEGVEEEGGAGKTSGEWWTRQRTGSGSLFFLPYRVPFVSPTFSKSRPSFVHRGEGK